MSQYKAAMERMRSGRGEEEPEISAEPKSFCREDNGIADANDSMPPLRRSLRPHPIMVYIEKNAPFILMPVLPLLWCLLLVLTLDRDDLLSSYGILLLGVCSATLANAVPVGGGIVFVPILDMLGVRIKLGTAFAVATMTFGNGVFGFLNWTRKNPRAIAWEIIPPAVVPAWFGSGMGTLRPLMSPEHCRSLFAAFALGVSFLVLRGLRVGRDNVRRGEPFSITRRVNDSEGGEPSPAGSGSSSFQRWGKLSTACICSFLAGFILVAHIGIGNAVVSFLVSSYIWKLPADESVVTSIIIGGWTSLCPFLLHLVVLRDVPIALWVMGLPGVYLGAMIAPMVHERVGIDNVLVIFVLFLLMMALIMSSDMLAHLYALFCELKLK